MSSIQHIEANEKIYQMCCQVKGEVDESFALAVG